MRNWLWIVSSCLSMTALAQVSDLNKGNAILLNMTYSGQLPGGDLSARFGPSMSVGGGLEFMAAKGNFIIGVEGFYLFGTEVREDVIAPLRTPEGFIIGNDKSYAEIELRQRGLYAGLLIGKLFALSNRNPRAGIRATLSAGILQHKIRIQEDPFRVVPQLTGAYLKGYDRLSNGLAFNQFLGYQMLSTDKRINFFAGIECTQAFTRNRRSFNFDTRRSDTEPRFDLLFGIRAGWILPFYVGQEAREIYY